MDQNFPVTEPPIEPPREEEVQPKLENVEEVAGVTPDVEAQPTVEIQVENGLDEERAAIKRKSEDERPEEFKKMFLADENTMQVDHVLNSLREVCEPAVETALNDGSGQSSSSSQSSETQPEFYAPQLYEPETEKMDDHKEETDYEEDDDPSPPQSQPNFITPELPTSDTIDIQEKLREMGEISVKPVSKNDPASTAKRKEGESEVSVEIKKKAASSVSDKFETEDSKRITNLRKNIREVMDENQLDATTLAAQRQESERLARVQVQQKIIRELQRQMAADRQNNRTQNRVLSLLQGQTSLMKSSTNADRSSTSQSGSSTDMYIVKGVASEVTFKGSNFVDVDKISSGNLTPSVSIAPVRRAKSIDEDSGSEEEKKEVVTIVDSSSEDDCIVLSDDDEEIEEEPEDDPHNSGLHVKDAYNIPDDQGRVVINIGHPESEDDIFLAPQIARIIKPHQIGGVRFLFDNIIESVERFDNSTGFGCILAHSMGLGKTLQIVCFCDIFLRHTSSKSVLCIMPINTLQNWMSEFNMWLPEDPEKTPLGTHGDVRPRNFKIFVLNDQHKTLSARSKVILEWSRVGGVLLIGYELYRLLSLKLANKKKKGKKGEKEKPETEAHKRLMEEIHSALVRPGPDLVICDEGHRIKNSHASISVALKQIRSKRRIVLTGYPLQNNLLEYWCMVDFVRPNYLGTKTEFANMFERPIQNGQCIDSTPQDIKLMRYRAHVLHSLLVGFVQRRSHVVLQNSLPQKEEYVILVRMTEFQRKLYDVFMNEVVRTKAVPNPLKAFAVCCKIWNHPDVLYNFLKKREADLDLELEEVEAEANATATTANTAAAANNRGRKKGPPKKAKEVNKDGKTIPAIEVQPNQGKIANENTESPTEEMTPKLEPEAAPTTPEPQLDPPPLAQPPTQAPPDPEIPQQPPPMQNHHYPNNYNQYNPYECDGYYGQQYGSMYPPQPPQYPNHPYEQPYMPNPDNYWQGNYYGYGNTPNPIPLDPYGQVEPSYASLVPKATESFEKTKPPSAEEKSSEIVDLDTKEIKTVEPTIIEEVEEVKEPEPEIKEEAAEELAILPLEKETIRSNAKDDGIPYDWAVELMKGYVPDLLDNSPKMVIFFRLLEESLKLGDRILVFSQSLLTLNLIERFLQKSNVPGFDYHWAKNTTYFRLDGSTTAMEREKLINEFNSNPHIHLFLVSTRAGSLGINLVGANRVIVLDASWNPCHDTQAVCRVYRYGQKKPCFVYRIVMDNCLEKKIYDRQVNKQGMSDRVVDECNPDAHLSMKEVTNLCYDNEEDGEVKDFSDCKDKYLDIVMQKIIELHYSLLSKEPFHHESLLVDRKEKKLSQAEKRLAQRGYEMEKRATAKPAYVYHSMGTQYRVMRTPDGAIVHRPVASVRPMQAESGEKSQITRPGGVRPTRWIPAEVWQRQGMTAQEMTLPLDVVIPTSSGDKANIVLKAGQKVMVLKSPKGIYMQLETGKIIAIRTSFKMGQHNKDKSDDGEAGSSNLTSPEDLLLKATKGDQSSPIHHSASNFLLGNGNSKKDDLGKTNLNFPTGKHGYPFEATNRSSKLNESGLHGSSFKSQSNNMAPNRNYPQHSTPNSKHFNVQSLIEGKGSSSGQHNTNVYPHAKGNQNAEAMLPESNRSGNSFSGSSKSNLFNSTSKAHYPRSNYSFTNALKQAQTHGSQHSLLANVKPHIHENKLWEQQHKAQQALKNAVVQQPGAHAPPTITIDDDLEPPLREKVVYKPNLVERKPKMQNPRTLSQNFGKQSNKNTPPQTSGNLKGSNSGSDSLRQLQNVKPYNRQYPDQRNGSTTQPKPIEETPPVQQAAPSPAPPVADVKSSPRPKMPAIRNIPAPYPSICVPHINSTATPTTTQSTSSYAQSNLTASSQDIGQHSSRSVPPSFTGHNTQQRQENSEYSLGRSSDKKPENLEPTKNSRPASETVTPKDKKLSAKQPPASAAPPPPAVIPAATIQPAAPTSATPPQTTSSAILDPQYPNYNQPTASTNLYAPPPAVSNDPNYNYSRPEPAPYQQPYPDIYGSAPTNNYAYPPAQHQPPPQSNYPYGSYYDPQMYGNMPATNSTPNYGNSVPPPPPPTQHQPGQFHPYPNYHQPPSAAPPHTPDPYNSYYNYPPYPPQTGQWQQ